MHAPVFVFVFGWLDGHSVLSPKCNTNPVYIHDWAIDRRSHIVHSNCGPFYRKLLHVIIFNFGLFSSNFGAFLPVACKAMHYRYLPDNFSRIKSLRFCLFVVSCKCRSLEEGRNDAPLDTQQAFDRCDPWMNEGKHGITGSGNLIYVWLMAGYF